MTTRHRGGEAPPIVTLTGAVLVIAAIVIALLTGSVAVLAQATHAAAELFASLAAVITHRGVPRRRRRLRPGVAEGVLVIGIAIVAAFAAVHAFGQSVSHPVAALVGMAASAVVARTVAARLQRVARAARSHQLAAEEQSLRSSALTAGLAALSNAVVALTGHATPDAVMALVIAGVVARRGLELATATIPGQAVREVRELEVIAAVLASAASEVIGYGAVRAVTRAGVRTIDVEVLVEPATTAVRQLELTRELEQTLRDQLGTGRIRVYIRKPDAASARRRPGSGRRAT